jgi:2-polyprenyl-3-methyl-5-hydroxy-6-metoxy-1,4-benzoquinol methylase
MSVEILSEVHAHDFPTDWYDLSEPEHFWFRWRLAALDRMLTEVGGPRGSQTRTLDVGCGSGVLAAQLETAFGWTVDATDLNMPALERCTPRRGRTLYYDLTEERPELVGRYDVLTLFDVLEHLTQPRALVRSAVRHLKPGGLLLVNVPADPMLMSAYDRAVGHVRRYTTASLASELEGAGVETRALRYWGFSLVPLLVARKIALAANSSNIVSRGFRPPSALVNQALVALMHVETRLVRAPPRGTSVLYAGAKRM